MSDEVKVNDTQTPPLTQELDAVILEIRAAEEQAEAIARDSYIAGKNIVLNAEAEADRQRKDAVEQCKQSRREALDAAGQRADKRRAAILAKGEAAAKKSIEEHRADVSAKADALVDVVLKKYGVK